MDLKIMAVIQNLVDNFLLGVRAGFHYSLFSLMQKSTKLKELKHAIQSLTQFLVFFDDFSQFENRQDRPHRF